MRFVDREDAGRRLAERLAGMCEGDLVVLGLPRGGVVVAAEVARALGAPLDVIVARKLGAPGHAELAIGAVTARGTRVLNTRALRYMALPPGYLEAETARQREEADRRERVLRGVIPAQPLAGRIAVVVDDGIATGMTMEAAIRDLQDLPPAERPAEVVVAAPVIAPDTHMWLSEEVDRVVALALPLDFMAVGAYYDDFSQTSDDEVRQLLAGQPAR